MKIIKRRIIEEITIEGLAKDRADASDYLLDNEYDIQRGGPKPIGNGKYDSTFYQIIATREYKEKI